MLPAFGWMPDWRLSLVININALTLTMFNRVYALSGFLQG